MIRGREGHKPGTEVHVPTEGTVAAQTRLILSITTKVKTTKRTVSKEKDLFQTILNKTDPILFQATFSITWPHKQKTQTEETFHGERTRCESEPEMSAWTKSCSTKPV